METMDLPLTNQEPIRRTRLSDTVYNSLLGSILGATIASGTIISEVRLAAQLGVSRTPVHDAIRQLAVEGLVDQQPGHRAIVRAFSEKDVREIIEVRRMLEAEACRLATARIDKSVVETLLADLGQLRGRSSSGLMAWSSFDVAFHSAIDAACGNERLCRELARYRRLHRGIPDKGYDSILLAMRDGDPVSAARWMAHHIELQGGST